MAKSKEELPETRRIFFVAPGKAITSLRGILSEGEEVQASDFAGGQPTLDMLIEGGFVL